METAITAKNNNIGRPIPCVELQDRLRLILIKADWQQMRSKSGADYNFSRALYAAKQYIEAAKGPVFDINHFQQLYEKQKRTRDDYSSYSFCNRHLYSHPLLGDALFEISWGSDVSYEMNNLLEKKEPTDGNCCFNAKLFMEENLIENTISCLSNSSLDKFSSAISANKLPEVSAELEFKKSTTYKTDGEKRFVINRRSFVKGMNEVSFTLNMPCSKVRSLVKTIINKDYSFVIGAHLLDMDVA